MLSRLIIFFSPRGAYDNIIIYIVLYHFLFFDLLYYNQYHVLILNLININQVFIFLNQILIKLNLISLITILRYLMIRKILIIFHL